MVVTARIRGYFDYTEARATTGRAGASDKAGVSALVVSRIDILDRWVERPHYGVGSAWKITDRIREGFRWQRIHTCSIVERVILVDRPYHRPAETPFIRVIQLCRERSLVVVRYPLIPAQIA